jgi:hypothetical protein
MRYFRSSESVYESIRAMLDQAYGYPNAQTLTLTAIPPASSSVRDSSGRIYLAVSEAYCEYVLPAEMLPVWISSGDVEEVGEAAYFALLPAMP